MRRFRYMSRRRKLVIGLVFAVILLAVAAFAFVWFSDKARSQLTGLEVDRQVAERPVLGIMIENSEAARPQTGLGSAGIVFETVTEGGITRYLALYQEDMADIVGPVRSLRPHFVDWMMGFDASVAHVGGSAEALQLVEERDAKSLTQFEYPDPYYRSDDRAAPHNMYARTDGLRALQGELEHVRSQFDEIPRSKDDASDDPGAREITIDFSSPTYEVEFRYQEDNNSYARYLAGEPHIDRATDEQITVKNVIVIKMPDESIEAVGEGEAFVFKDGGAQEVRWQKDSYGTRLKIIDNEGNEVPLNRGGSWIAVIPGDKSVIY
jgi:hypothetical protein